MSSPDQLKRTTLSVSRKAQARVNALQAVLRDRLGYKPAHSEVIIRGMEALAEKIEAGR